MPPSIVAQVQWPLVSCRIAGAWLKKQVKSQVLGQKTQVKSQVLGRKTQVLGRKTQVLGRKKQGNAGRNTSAWCLVLGDQGPRTKDQALTTFICQVADKATDALMCFCGLVVDTGEFVIVDVFLIQCCVELTFDFCA